MVLWITWYPQVCTRAFCGLCVHMCKSDIGRCSAFSIRLFTLQCFLCWHVNIIWPALYLTYLLHVFIPFQWYLFFYFQRSKAYLPAYDECATPETPSKEIVMPTWRRKCHMREHMFKMCAKSTSTLNNTRARESQICRLSMTSHIDYARRHVVASWCAKPQVTARIER